MNLSTRERLIQAATRLFADGGYRGASVRDICNLAGTNPGAVSYHFGGKKQLYRAVLRQAAAGLATMASPADVEEIESAPPGAVDVLGRILRQVQEDDTSIRLLLRDLADGGGVAVEALTPPLRSAFEHIATTIGHGDNSRASREARLQFLELASPLFLLTTAWPVVARALELDADQREDLLKELVLRVIGSHQGLEPVNGGGEDIGY